MLLSPKQWKWLLELIATILTAFATSLGVASCTVACI